MRRIGWQGRSRALAIREKLEQRLQSWREGWFGARLPEAGIVSIDPSDVPEDAVGFRLSGAQSSIWLLASDDAGIRLAAEALQLQQRNDELIRRVGDACIEDLGASLWASHSISGFERGRGGFSDVSTDLLRHGGLAFSIMGLPAHITVLVDRGWCDAQLPPSDKAYKRPLTDRRKAIGATRVVVKATVDLGEIALIDSTGWSPGELLLTDAPRTLRASLTLADRKIQAGLMGVRGDKKMLAIS